MSATRTRRLGLTLGPVLFNWPTGEWVDFYHRVADEMPVDRVCVGEVICSKRMPFRNGVITAVIERLARGGKEVVCSTLALPTLPREIAAIRDMIDAGYMIEANDISTTHMLAGRPHVIGPYLNIYNEESLAQHVALGAIRVCLPPELSLDTVRLLARSSDAIEVFAFGRAPLALSARCYHARAHGLTKDSCQFVCERDADGMEVTTMDGRPFLAVNGIQTLGHAVTAAVRQTGPIRDCGVASLRLSPQTCDMVEVSRIFRDLADAGIDDVEAVAALSELRLPGPLGDGYLRGVPGARTLQEVD
jgi:collagenase-like PrtC family protease